MLKVRKVELWKMEINYTFSCNSSDYMIDAEFHCFGYEDTMLPNIYCLAQFIHLHVADCLKEISRDSLSRDQYRSITYICY